MGFFNDKVVAALESGDYICSKCGSKMKFEDKWADVLICPKCGHSIDYERYGFENDEDYDALFPTKEEVLGIEADDEDDVDEEDTGESYEEIHGELGD